MGMAKNTLLLVIALLVVFSRCIQEEYEVEIPHETEECSHQGNCPHGREEVVVEKPEVIERSYKLDL